METEQIQNSSIQLGSNSNESMTTETITTEVNATGVISSSQNTASTADTNSNNRITKPSKHREERRPRYQWSSRMNFIIHGLKYKVGSERGWMKRLHSKWLERLPMYTMFTAQNLRDQVKKAAITLPSNMDLDQLINEEMEEFKERQKTRTGTIADEDEQLINRSLDESSSDSEAESLRGSEEDIEKMFESGEESFNGFTDEELQKDRDEQELNADMKYWEGLDIEKRKAVKGVPTREDVEYWNERMGNIINTKDSWDLWEIDCLIYAAMVRMKGRKRSDFVNDDNKQKKKWKKKEEVDARKAEIQALRKRIAWICDIIKFRTENRKLSKKQVNNLLFIKRKYKVSKTSKLKELEAKLKQRVKVVAARIKRSKKSKRYKEENQKFKRNPGQWMKEQTEKEKEEVKGGPAESDLTKFWRNIWSKESVDTSQQWEAWEEEVKKSITIRENPDDVPFVSQGLLKKVIKKMKPWKAAGWDQIAPFYWQKLTNTHKALQEAINTSFQHATCDDWETLGRTVMFAKKGKDPTKPESYRPITCLLIIYKIRTALVANRLNKHLHENNLWPFEQFGTLANMQGAKEVLLLDGMIANEVKTYKRNIFMVWTDVKKAFDSVCQNHLLRILHILKVPAWIINWITQAMKSWRTKLQVNVDGEMLVTDVIYIIRGIFQGDSLSPLLFCISYIFVSIILRNLRSGYIPGPPGRRDANKMRSHMIFMDDFKGMSTNEESFKQMIMISKNILKEVGLEVGYDKCAVMKVERGRVADMEEGVKVTLDEVIEEVNKGEGYAYLGILELLDPFHEKTKSEMAKKTVEKAEVIWKSELNEKNKVMAHNMFIISKLMYTFGIINWTREELRDLDRKMRKIISESRCLNIHSNVKRLYLNRKGGGRGLMNIEHTHNRMISGLVAYVFNAKSEHAKLVKEFWMYKKAGTLLKRAEDVLEDLNLNIKFTEEGVLEGEKILHHKKVGRAIKNEYQKEYKGWMDTNLHGKIMKECAGKGMQLQQSFRWLEKSGLRGEAVSTIFAIQEQVMPTRVVKKRIWHSKDVQSEKCRMCGSALETIAHLVDGCSALVGIMYKERHDNMLRGVYYYLLHTLGFVEEWYPWYNISYVEPVKENSNCTLYWDIGFQTNNYIKYNKPDIVVIYKEKDEILIIEGSCPWDENVEQKVVEKRTKYIPLAIELKNLYEKKKCTIVDLVIGATGTVTTSMWSAMEKIAEGNNDRCKMMNNCQKATLLGTVRICRQVFDGSV